MNVKGLPLEAKVAVAMSAFAAFMISPVFWGIILLLAIGAYQAPWPFVAIIATAMVMFASWLVLRGRLKSDSLVAFDILVPIFLLGCLFGTSSYVGFAANYIWSSVIYIICALEVFLHSYLALFYALGFTIQTAEESTKPVVQAA